MGPLLLVVHSCGIHTNGGVHEICQRQRVCAHLGGEEVWEWGVQSCWASGEGWLTVQHIAPENGWKGEMHEGRQTGTRCQPPRWAEDAASRVQTRRLLVSPFCSPALLDAQPQWACGKASTNTRGASNAGQARFSLLHFVLMQPASLPFTCLSSLGRKTL